MEIDNTITDFEDNSEVIPVPFSIIDNAEGEHKHLAPGYFFVIGDFTEEDDNNIQNGLNLEAYAGPYDTEEDAVEAAVEEVTNLFKLIMGEIENGNVGDEDIPSVEVLSVKKVD